MDFSICKQQIEKDLESPHRKLLYTYEENIKGKSPYLKLYKQIKYQGRTTAFVKCKQCGIILSYNGKTGTGSIVRHKCGRIFYERFITPKQNVPDVLREMIARNEIEMLVRDLQPFSVIEGNGFKEFIQNLINLGAQYGQETLKNLIIEPKTLFPDVCQEIKSLLKQQLQNQEFFSFSIDCWSCNNRNFMTVSISLIDELSKYRKWNLGSREIHNNQILDGLISILIEYFSKPEKVLSKSVIVTNDEIRQYLDDFTCYSCACNLLNSVLNQVFTEIENEDLKSTLDAIRAIAVYFEKSNLNQRLTKKFVHLPVTNQWNTLYSMLENFCEMDSEIENLLLETNEILKFTQIDLTIVKSLVAFLKLFKDCSEDLSSDNKPTINKFVLCEQKLKKHCTVNIDDTNMIKDLKMRILGKLNETFTPRDMHYIALFLDPNFKNMKFLPAAQRQYIITQISSLIKQNKEEPIIKQEIIEKNETLYMEFQDFNTTTTPEISREVFEIETYLRSRERGNEDLLDYWKNRQEFPLLKKLVLEILNVPASAIMAERVFSEDSKHFVNGRQRVEMEFLDEFLFLNQNYEVFYKAM